MKVFLTKGKNELIFALGFPKKTLSLGKTKLFWGRNSKRNSQQKDGINQEVSCVGRLKIF